MPFTGLLHQYLCLTYFKDTIMENHVFSVIMALGTMAVFEWIIGRKIIDALALRIKKLGRILAKPLKKLCKVVKLIFYKVIKNIRAKKEKKNAGRKRKKSHVKAKHHKAKRIKE